MCVYFIFEAGRQPGLKSNDSTVNVNSTEKEVTFHSDKRDCSLLTVSDRGRKKKYTLAHKHTEGEGRLRRVWLTECLLGETYCKTDDVQFVFPHSLYPLKIVLCTYMNVKFFYLLYILEERKK